LLSLSIGTLLISYTTMADIYNSPNGSGNNPGGWIIAIVVLIIIVLLLFMLFPNLFAGRGDNMEVNTQIPAAGTGGNNGGDNTPDTIINNTTINATSTFGTTTGNN
jgi:hypothetical protein